MPLVSRKQEPAAGPVLERFPARVEDVGGAAVRRLLPNRRRTIGAFCFADHFGPTAFTPNTMQVPPHPHIGLQTVTWLLAGEILHLDSIGSRQEIRPGQLNWMTAGRGIAHAEEALPRSRELHGVQLWVALPESARRGDPAFDHHPRLPVAEEPGITTTLLVGELAGLKAEARTFSPLLAAQLDFTRSVKRELTVEPEFEHGVLVTKGAATIEGERLEPGTLLHLGRRRRSIAIEVDGDAGVMLLGGAPFEEPLLMWWNFVGRSDEEIREARRAWAAGELGGAVPGAHRGALAPPPLP